MSLKNYNIERAFGALLRWRLRYSLVVAVSTPRFVSRRRLELHPNARPITFKMRLLIITQKIDINDDVLGFMHGWIAEFAKHCDKVTAVCLEKGEYDLPENVKVLSLGKENKLRITNYELRILKRIRFVYNFYKYIWKERNNYDKAFVHMNDEYVVLGGLLWRMMGKKIGLWYAHGHVPLSLRIAEKFVHVIFTSTPGGCRLKSGKIKVVGQGIDTNRITNYELRITNDKFKIVTIGRISPSKDYETLILAAKILTKENLNFEVDIIGGPGTPKQEEYLENLIKMVKDSGLEEVINFKGPMPNREIAPVLNKADLFVNMGLTGSLDKAILEAMSTELPILTCNEALKDVLGDYKERLMFKKKDYMEMSAKIKAITRLDPWERAKIGRDLREIVVKNHSLGELVKKIIRKLE